jgi:glucose-1-phosphate cytidylyltransferase
MKAVILAGGFGTRLSEETESRPKPMVEIGGYPILWHIMKNLSVWGIREFIICLGYRGYMIKEYFANYRLHMSDVTLDFATGTVDFHRMGAEDWRVVLIETGLNTMTGGRLRRVGPFLEDEDAFLLTYGDGVADVNVDALVAHHRAHGGLATVTAVAPPARFGALELGEQHRVMRFREKPAGESGLINGGYFVLSPKVLNYVDGDETVWEQAPLEALAKDGQLHAYAHGGFWYAMDTLRDKQHLERLWASGQAPWKKW